MQRAALWSATLASFLAPFMGSSVNIALPSIAREYAIDAILLSWITTAYLVAAAVFLVPFGRIADIWGRKRVFAYGIVIFTVASLFSVFATSAPNLIFCRFVHGIGGAMIVSTRIAILTSVFPARERGRVLGINIAAIYCGLFMGPFIGGILTEYFGWRSIFIATVPLGGMIICLVTTKLKGEWAEARGERFDVWGSIIYIVAVLSIMCGFSWLHSLPGIVMIGIGALGIAAFIKWELTVRDPVFPVHVFRRNRVFTFSNVAAFINYSATFATSFVLSLYLQYIKGLSPKHAGLVLISQSIVMAAFSPLAGRLSDRMEPRIVASAGMTITTVGLFFLMFLNETSTMEIIVAVLILHGVGFALFSSPNANAVMSAVEDKFFGVASGTLGTMRLTGMMFSMGIATLVFALQIGRVEIVPAFYPLFLKSMRILFGIFTFLCGSGIFFSLSRGNLRKQSPAVGGVYSEGTEGGSKNG
ncbi:MAG: MFS transporter [Deltaproteobacteria bacterium]|nr:MFS transporter [Deltaproteobacteria bacterium]